MIERAGVDSGEIEDVLMGCGWRKAQLAAISLDYLR